MGALAERMTATGIVRADVVMDTAGETGETMVGSVVKLQYAMDNAWRAVMRPDMPG